MGVEYGFLSLAAPLIAIILAIVTRQVYLSLGAGLYIGYLIISDYDPFTGLLALMEGLVEVLADAGSSRTIMFGALVGAVIVLIQRSGGVAGFIKWLEPRLERMSKEPHHRRRNIQLAAFGTGIIVFVESSMSVLTVGTLFRPLFDKLRISREKLAYIADSSSAPICILIPLNAWGAFIMGLLATEGVERPFAMMMQAMVFNFYPILALTLLFVVILSDFNILGMKKAERRARIEGKVLADEAIPVVSDEVTAAEAKEGVPQRMYNMLIPIVVMVLMMPVMLAYTGWEAASAGMPGEAWRDVAFSAIGQGSGSTAVLMSVVTAIIVAVVIYAVQGLFSLGEMVDLTLKGISGLMPVAILMLFAFAISNLCRTMGTGPYVAGLVEGWLNPSLVPVLIFLTSCFIAFSTGTSWGTFAIMIAIALPMAEVLDANMLLTLAAVMGGGVFGDHCSPISDTSILSSLAAASDHMDHVQTQLPYALLAGGGAIILYLISGYFL